ncbi:MAG TPA: rhomboid family intramembrane serine protease [Kofleriaceae bacterium]|nr:rhomboid family intramembrane serine protease [Kofleriaceae bacterium]
MARRRWQRFMGGQAQITRGALYLLFVSVGLSLVFLISNDEVRANLAYWLGASGYTVWSELRIWQLVTSPLLETSFISLLFQAFALWMFLPALERWWGMKRFLLFALYTSVTGVAAGTLLGWALGGVHGLHFVTGLDPFVFSGIVAYGILFSNQQVQFFGVLPMTGKQLTIGIVAFVALFILIGQAWVDGAALAASMLLTWAIVSDRFAPRLWLLKAKQRRLRRRRGHLHVVEDQRKGDKKRWMN